MIFDGMFALTVALLAFIGWQEGAPSQFWRTSQALIALVVAALVAHPVGAFVLKAIDGTLSGLTVGAFLGLVVLTWMLSRFFVSHSLEQSGTETWGPNWLNSLLGAVLGAVRGGTLGYFALCAMVLLSQTWTPSNPDYSFQYQEGRISGYVLMRNMVDPAPIPFSEVFQALVDTWEDPTRSPSKFEMLEPLGRNPRADFLFADAQFKSSFQAGDWRTLRRNQQLRALVTDPGFVTVAQHFLTTIHSVEEEDPDSRFRELGQ